MNGNQSEKLLLVGESKPMSSKIHVIINSRFEFVSILDSVSQPLPYMFPSVSLQKNRYVYSAKLIMVSILWTTGIFRWHKFTGQLKKILSNPTSSWMRVDTMLYHL